MSIPTRNTIDNLTEWLLLQIAEDEMKARTAGSEPWRWRVVDAPTQRDALVRPNGTICADSWGADRQETGFRGAETKMFIERFNPERVSWPTATRSAACSLACRTSPRHGGRRPAPPTRRARSSARWR